MPPEEEGKAEARAENERSAQHEKVCEKLGKKEKLTVTELQLVQDLMQVSLRCNSI